MFPPSCSASFDTLRSSAEGLKSGGTERLTSPVVPVVLLPPPPPPPPPALPFPLPTAAPVSSRSLPSKELPLLLTLSAGERPVGGSRHSREPGYCGGAVRMEPPEVEDGVVEGGQGVLRSRPGETGSDLMLTLEFVLTVSMVPWGIWGTGLRRGLWKTGRGRKCKVRSRNKEGKQEKKTQTISHFTKAFKHIKWKASGVKTKNPHYSTKAQHRQEKATLDYSTIQIILSLFKAERTPSLFPKDQQSSPGSMKWFVWQGGWQWVGYDVKKLQKINRK